MTCLRLMHLPGHSFLNLIFNFAQSVSSLIPRKAPTWLRMPERAAALKICRYYVVIICDYLTERCDISHSSDAVSHTLLPRRKSLLSLLIKLLKFIIAG